MALSRQDIFLSMHQSKFAPSDIPIVKERLDSIKDENLLFLNSLELRDPSNMLLIAILLGWERFWLDDILLGVLKIFTGFGCMLWWLIDIFTAKKRTYRFNLKKFLESTAHL